MIGIDIARVRACLIVVACAVFPASSAVAQSLGEAAIRQLDRQLGLGVYAGVEGGFGAGSSSIGLAAFDVPISGPVGGAYLEAAVPVSPNLLVGGRVGLLIGDISGEKRDTVGRDHRVEIGPVFVITEAFAQASFSPTYNNQVGQPAISFSVGGVFSSNALQLFVEQDKQTVGGITASVGLETPLAPGVALTGRARYINFLEPNFFQPNDVRMESQVWIGTAGLKFNIR